MSNINKKVIDVEEVMIVWEKKVKRIKDDGWKGVSEVGWEQEDESRKKEKKVIIIIMNVVVIMDMKNVEVGDEWE